MNNILNSNSDNKAESYSDFEKLLIQKQRQQISLIEKKHTDTILSLIRSYEKQLKEKQQQYDKLALESINTSQESVERVEKNIKSTLTWRVGYYITHPVIIILKCVRNVYYSILKSNKGYETKKDSIPKKDPNEPVAFYTNRNENLNDDQIDHFNSPVLAVNKPHVLCIFDDFTETCFRNEFNILSPTPKTWESCLKDYTVSAVFVESAWHGNGNTWEYLLSNYGGVQKLETLSKLLLTAKKNGIPTIFWNKEDPVHFNGFTDTAKLFDFVYTSDADCIAKYLKISEHKNVYALPFAAQHSLHNPINAGQRNKTVAFAGSYYNFHYAERKLDLDILLMPAMDFGLEIYDRNFGVKGLAHEEYKFPDIFQNAIKGSLTYQEMLNAYKEYKVFLNVNSVKYSPTMFARRAIELLACGTPVISNYSQGLINLLGEDVVSIVENENQTKSCLEKLLGDNHYWWRKSLQGMRQVMEAHTYAHRTEEIFTRIQVPFAKKSDIRILVVVKVLSMADVQYVSELIHLQNYAPAGILFLCDSGYENSYIRADNTKLLFPEIHCELVTEISINSIRNATDDYDYSHIAFINPDNYYGKNYLRDFVLAINYTNAKILGKKDKLTLNNSGNLIIPDLTNTYKWVDSLPNDTLMVSKEVLNPDDTFKLVFFDDFQLQNEKMFSIDPFNYLNCGKERYLAAKETISEIVGI